jgi:hypothetical protein
MEEEKVSVSRQDLLVLVHAGRAAREPLVAEAARRLQAEVSRGDDVQFVLETRLALERARESLLARAGDECAIRERARGAGRRLTGIAKGPGTRTRH